MPKRYHDGERNPAGIMRRSSNMIKEDHSAACLLPTHVIEKEWPDHEANYHMKYVDTLFNGVQNQMKEDVADFGKAFGPRKY